jgi:phosphoesterase RecJ-like protein
VSVSRDEVLAELREGQKFLCVTHENPDGDAVGSLSAMTQVLTALGKDVVAFMDASEFPLPYEYRFISLDSVVTEPPADLEERTIVFLDCGNIERNPADALKREGMHIVNIDHHHDNTRFGTVDYVRPEASCTAEIVWCLMQGLGAELTQPIAEALYVGLVTDTGRFMYENTGPSAHEMAASLLRAGIDVHAIYRRLYEGVPQGKVALLAATSSPPAPTSPTPRAWSTTCARSRALRLRASSATSSPPTAPGPRAARSPCAPPTTASTCR